MQIKFKNNLNLIIGLQYLKVYLIICNFLEINKSLSIILRLKYTSFLPNFFISFIHLLFHLFLNSSPFPIISLSRCSPFLYIFGFLNLLMIVARLTLSSLIIFFSNMRTSPSTTITTGYLRCTI